MKDRNEFWQSQPKLLAKNIQTANKKAGILDSSAAILWHYTATQAKLTNADREALARQHKPTTKSNLPTIVKWSAGSMVTVISTWMMLFANFMRNFELSDAILGIVFILMLSIAITAITLPLILLFLAPLICILENPDDFAPTKNSGYVLSNEGLYIYSNNMLKLEVKIPIADITAIKTNPQNVEIYTNIVTPRILNIPAPESETLKQHLLSLSADILDANK